jgi:hypothetical protein
MFNIQSIWKKSRGSQVHCLAIVSILFLFSDHIYIYIVSEWLLLKVKWASFQLSWREQIGFQWDDVLFVLDQHALLEFYSAISLREKKPVMLLHSDTLSWFRGPSSSWSYGSWIHNYLCNQCLSPLWSCEFESRSWRGVLDITLCDKVCQWLATGRWFSLVPVSSTSKTDRHDITEILLKVALSNIDLILIPISICCYSLMLCN